jgi:hypothetical protein
LLLPLIAHSDILKKISSSIRVRTHYKFRGQKKYVINFAAVVEVSSPHGKSMAVFSSICRL